MKSSFYPRDDALAQQDARYWKGLQSIRALLPTNFEARSWDARFRALDDLWRSTEDPKVSRAAGGAQMLLVHERLAANARAATEARDRQRAATPSWTPTSSPAAPAARPTPPRALTGAELGAQVLLEAQRRVAAGEVTPRAAPASIVVLGSKPERWGLKR